MKAALYYLPDFVPTTPETGGAPTSWEKTKVIGTARPRVDAYERLSGTAIYPSDVRLPGMLYGAIVRSPHPHARVSSVDISRAAVMPGVVAVISDQDPETRIPWYFDDHGTPIARLFDPHCRFEGEAVAAVAAESPQIALDAARAVEVDFEVLSPTTDYEAATKLGAAAVRDGGNVARDPGAYVRGDIAAGFADAEVIVERTFRTACELHTPLEPHGCVARWDGPRLVVWESSQGVYAVQGRLARALDLPLANVRVIGHYVGGGFGSKLATGKFSVIASLLSRRTARPVKLFLSREETFLCVGNRPANRMRLKAGIKKDGTLTALEFDGLGSGGAYSSSGTAILDWQIRDLYLCPNVKTATHNVYIHAGEERPMRAPGHPQCSWALEQVLDELAEKIGMDPVELRRKNVPNVSQGRGGQPYTSTGLDECLARGAEAFGFKAAKNRDKNVGDGRVRGVGMASCVWIAGAGGPPSTVVVKYFRDGSANLNMGASDIGTGTKTVMAMVVAEELGVALDKIQIEHADTGTTQYATPSGGSKTVPTESPAVRAAAVECKRQLLEMAAEVLEVPAGELAIRDGEVVSLEDGTKKIAVGEIPAFRRAQLVVGIGYRGPNPEGKAVCPFAAQFCEVEVDTRTGEVVVLRFLGAHDSGRVMSRKSYDNQVHGGIVMGIGLGMTERRVLDVKQTGKMVNRSWHDYKIPTALDVPAEIVSLPIDPGDDACNSTGAKGLGEPVTIPTAAAIANAVYDATGVRFTDTPINPTRLQELIETRKTDSGRS